MLNQTQNINRLTEKLITILDTALDAITPDNLLTDRAALRNLTGALKDLQDLLQVASGASGGGKAAESDGLTVAFEGDTAQMSE